jgi:acyl dehydratase
MADQLYWEDVEVGTQIPDLTIHITTQKMVLWAAAGESYPQIHYDPYFAREQAKNPDVIVHGFQKHAYLGRMLYEWVKPAGQVLEYGCQFRGMDFPNQDMTCRGVVTKKYQADGLNYVDLDIWTEAGPVIDDGRPKNPEGAKTSPGTGRVALPSRNAS